MASQNNTIVSEIELAGIPCLWVKPNNNEIAATVILYHGWSSYKEYLQFFASTISQYGYQVILPDLLHHGERGILNYADVNVQITNFWPIITQTVVESKDLIDSVVKTCNADINKLAVIGESLGGFSAAGVFAHNTFIKCLVNLNGSCAWEKAEEVFGNVLGMPPKKEDLSLIRKYDPILHKDKLNLRPMLLIHGTPDTVVPIESQKYFYNQILPIYGESNEDLKFVEISRLNHYITINMTEDTVNWLDKYFK